MSHAGNTCDTGFALCQHNHGWYMQVCEVFMHLLHGYDDTVVEHGHDLLRAAIMELHMHAKSVPLVELQKLSLATVRSDTVLALQ